MTTDNLITNLWSYREELGNGVSMDRLTSMSGATTPLDCIKASNTAVAKGRMESHIDARGKMYIRLYK